MTISTPIVAVWVSNKKLNASTIQKIRQLRMTFPEKKASSGEIVFLDSDHRLHDSKAFEKGKVLTFMFGWTHEIDFRGPFYIKAYKKSFPEQGDPRLVVKFQDKTHRMNKKQKRKRFTGTPDAILKQIAQTHGLKFDLETIPGLTFTDDFPLMQANITDAALIHRLAKRYGYRWGVDGNVLFFRKPTTEKEKVGRQKTVPVLFYRTNDHSLRAFSPEVKFTHKRKRKNPLSVVNALGEVDIESDSLYNHDAAMTDIDIEAEIDDEGDLVSTDIGDQDEDAFADNDEDTDTSDIFETDVEELESEVHEADLSDTDIETEYGDESGAAVPSEEAELERRKEAIRMQSTEVITGKAIPHTASVTYRPGDSLVLAGVGDRFSGKYRITEVEQIITEGGESFTTSLKVERRSFVREYTTYKLISEAAQTQNDTFGSQGGQPEEESLPLDKLASEEQGFLDYVKESVTPDEPSTLGTTAKALLGF